ncbi:MAG: UvrD-helicase domain-containing protein [Bacteroidetes bacterium]|nr:UvrD-helicase domain-containing protein [Bacteroidota bacterium]
MRFIGDLHIHSHFSIATSQELNPEHLDYWAGIKGIEVVGSGDFTHPGWLQELKEKLEPAEEGLFRIKKAYRKQSPALPGHDMKSPTRFILSSEISNIYKKNNKVKKIHNIIFAPDLESVERLQRELKRMGFNITSDGRPILGLDSRDLLEMVLNCSDKMFLVPAHIWTPWFSVLGAQSGFDSIEECYADLASYVYAAETGLSSDPPMNWMCSILDRYTLISNSDAHSPDKLGRNANLFNTELSYNGIIDAIKTGDPEKLHGTIDFFPQEGKYHYAGHRKCGICWNPLETVKNKGICTVCGKSVTMGVMNRVVELSDRNDILERKNRLPFYSLIPLPEILSEIYGVGTGTKQVKSVYFSLIQKAGSEFNILLNMSIEEIKNLGHDILSEAIRRMRNREVILSEGYDGEFGRIKVFGEGEVKRLGLPNALFESDSITAPVRKPIQYLSFDLSEYQTLKGEKNDIVSADNIAGEPYVSFHQNELLSVLNDEQRMAAGHMLGPALIIAGPGTGKTRVLAYRIAHLVNTHDVNPRHILAVTFTNKAAEEMRERVVTLIGEDKARQVTISTFHALGYAILKEHIEKTGRKRYFSIIDEDEKKQLLHLTIADKGRINLVAEYISRVKQELIITGQEDESELKKSFQNYESALRQHNLFDLDDLIYETFHLLNSDPAILSGYRERFRYLFIDEYQDINHSQYQLVRLLMNAEQSNLCVIGDPNQAIYGFRGADVRFIKNFVQDYPATKVYKLVKSYRCSDNILQVSHNVIHQTNEVTPVLSGLQKGVRVNIVENASDKSEAEFIARTIEKMMGGLRFFSMDSQISTGIQDKDIKSLSDFAILCRIGKQMNAIEKAFHDHSIPYCTFQEIPFFKTEPVTTIIDLLRLSQNPDNLLLIMKLKNNPAIKMIHPNALQELIHGNSIVESVEFLRDYCFKDQLKESKDAIRQFQEMIMRFGDDIEGLLRFILLGNPIDTFNPGTEQVRLMTIHAAKGLEFKCVFIAGCEDGLIPYSLFSGHEANTEEERRLLYVGMTRAMKYLWITHARKRFLMGREYQLRRSPFLDHIEKELLEISKAEVRKDARKEDRQLDLF